MSYYKNHLFFCTNQKQGPNKEPKECCENHQASAMAAYAKQKAATLGLTKACKFRVSTSGCMGRCAQGPVLAIYPAGEWFTYSSTGDIDQILESIANEETLLGNILETENLD